MQNVCKHTTVLVADLRYGNYCLVSLQRSCNVAEPLLAWICTAACVHTCCTTGLLHPYQSIVCFQDEVEQKAVQELTAAVRQSMTGTANAEVCLALSICLCLRV